MKQRNPRYGCPRITQGINLACGLDLDKDVARRIIGFAVRAGNVDGPSLCRMFNHASSGQCWPHYLSSDNDPQLQYHRWKANLCVLEVEAVKPLPHVPMSHPFVGRLIGSVRRELLDQRYFGLRQTWRTS